MTVSFPRRSAPVRPRPTGRREAAVLALAGVLYAVVFVVRIWSDDVTTSYSMFYMLPVALIASSFGMRAGAAAGLLAVLLIAVWGVVQDVDLSVVAWATRVLPPLLLGVLLGRATDQARRTEEQRRALEAAALLHREAIEINDSLVQGLVAAKWAFEAGNTAAGLQTLDDTLSRAHELVSDLIRRADMGSRSVELPTVTVGPTEP